MLGVLRDFVPRLKRAQVLDDATRALLLMHCQRAMLACRWTHFHCAVAGMAVAALLDTATRAEYVTRLIHDTSIDLGARLCLCRGLANSCTDNDRADLVCRTVYVTRCNGSCVTVSHVRFRRWPFVQLVCAHDLSSKTTTVRHFAVSALDTIARSDAVRGCAGCFDGSVTQMLEQLLYPLTELVAVNYDSPVHAQLESGMRAALELFDAGTRVFSLLLLGGVCALTCAGNRRRGKVSRRVVVVDWRRGTAAWPPRAGGARVGRVSRQYD